MNPQPNPSSLRGCRLGLAILALCACLPSMAQQSSPVFYNLTTEKGLPHDNVYSLLIDRQGYLWVGTGYGICRYDGYAFKRYKPDSDVNYTPAMHLQESASGRIWTQTLLGHLFYTQGDSILMHPVKDTILKYQGQYNRAEGFYVDEPQGVFYIALQGLGILKINPEGQQEVLASQHPSARIIWRDGPNLLSALYSSNPSMNTYNEGLKLQKLLPPLEIYGPTQQPPITINNLRNDYHQNSLSLCTGILKSGAILAYGHGQLYLIDGQRVLWQGAFPYEPTKIYEDQQGSIFLACQNNEGLVRYRGLEAIKAGQMERYLEGKTITSIVQDQGQGYWIGTWGDGLLYTPGWNLTVMASLPDGEAFTPTCLAAKNAETLFIGNRTGRIYQYHLPSKTLEALPEIEGATYVYELFYDPRSGYLWCATNALHYFDGQAWHTISNIVDKQGRPANPGVQKLRWNPRTDRLWFCGWGGYAALDLKTMTTARASKDFEMTQRTYCVLEDEETGIEWAGVKGVLCQVVRDSLILLRDENPLFNFPAVDIRKLHDGTIAATLNSQGIALIGRDGQVRRLHQENGLASNAPGRIIPDQPGRFWALSSEGISRVQLGAEGEFSIQNFTAANGLPSNSINDLLPHEGDIWMASSKGLIRWRLPSGTAAPPAPPIIEYIAVNNQPVSLEAQASFPHHQSNLLLQFSSLQYQFFGKVPYRFRLTPQSEWSYTQDHRLLLPALAPGRYDFEVQAQNQDGLWSESATYPFTIRPPWYKSWPARLGGAGLLALGFLGFYRYRIDQVRQQNALQQKTLELERAALQAQMNPHFIFNCLNSIQGFIAANDKGRATTFLAQFARLIRQTLEHSFHKEVSLEDELDYLHNYLSLEHLRFRDVFRYEIVADESLDTYETALPSMLVQPFVENAIVHGMKGKTGEGLISVRFEPYGKGLRITIADNGPGISAEQTAAGKPKSYGTQLAHRRLALADQYTEASIRSGPGPEGGTLVEIVLA